MTETTQIPWSVVAAIISFFAAVAGAAVALYLRDIKKCLSVLGKRIDRQDDLINENQQRTIQVGSDLAEYQVQCQRDFVTAESFIRSEAFTRKKLDKIAESFAALNGNIQIAQRMPEMVGTIARELLTQLNKGT